MKSILVVEDIAEQILAMPYDRLAADELDQVVLDDEVEDVLLEPKLVLRVDDANGEYLEMRRVVVELAHRGQCRTSNPAVLLGGNSPVEDFGPLTGTRHRSHRTVQV